MGSRAFCLSRHVAILVTVRNKERLRNVYLNLFESLCIKVLCHYLLQYQYECWKKTCILVYFFCGWKEKSRQKWMAWKIARSFIFLYPTKKKRHKATGESFRATWRARGVVFFWHAAWAARCASGCSSVSSVYVCVPFSEEARQESLGKTEPATQMPSVHSSFSFGWKPHQTHF